MMLVITILAGAAIVAVLLSFVSPTWETLHKVATLLLGLAVFIFALNGIM